MFPVWVTLETSTLSALPTMSMLEACAPAATLRDALPSQFLSSHWVFTPFGCCSGHLGTRTAFVSQSSSRCGGALCTSVQHCTGGFALAVCCVVFGLTTALSCFIPRCLMHSTPPKIVVQKFVDTTPCVAQTFAHASVIMTTGLRIRLFFFASRTASIRCYRRAGVGRPPSGDPIKV